MSEFLKLHRAEIRDSRFRIFLFSWGSPIEESNQWEVESWTLVAYGEEPSHYVPFPKHIYEQDAESCLGFLLNVGRGAILDKIPQYFPPWRGRQELEDPRLTELNLEDPNLFREWRGFEEAFQAMAEESKSQELRDLAHRFLDYPWGPGAIPVGEQ